MEKIIFNFEFSYAMDESMGLENEENAKYKIEINDVKLSSLEIEDILLYVSADLKKEMGYCDIQNKQINNELIVDIDTDQIGADNIVTLLDKIHAKFILLFNSSKVADVVPIFGHNDLTYNTNKNKPS